MNRWLNTAVNLFPLWVAVMGALALWMPGAFTWFRGGAIVWGLAFIMLGMGITLTTQDFRRVLEMPRAVALGVLAQYTVMPLLGWGVAKALALETSLAVGLILVACCPGGTASNLVTYLAKSNVALSVVLTMCSTFLAVFMTPLLTRWLAGALVEVDALGLFWSTVQVVLLPVVLGVTVNRWSPRFVQAVMPVAPLGSALVIALICASIIGQNADAIRVAGLRLLAAVFLLHGGGFALGWVFARVFRLDAQTCRTVSIEVGMQNSGLGVVLAQRHFPGTAAAVPCAISSVFHSVIGSALAGFWRWTERDVAPVPTPPVTGQP